MNKLSPKRLFSFLTACGIAVIAVGTTAHAHSIWFAHRATQIALIYGVGADDLDAVKRMDKLTSVAGYDEDWMPVETELRVAGPIPVVDSEEPLSAVVAAMDYGSWAKTPDGEWHNASRKEFPDAVIAEHNFKYAVFLTKMPKGEVPLFEGQRLQLVPVAGAIPQSMGMPIILKAYYDGKPQEGVEIITDYINDPDQLPLVTGADGTVTFPVRNQGLNIITGIYRAEPEDPEAFDHYEQRATLGFVLPHMPE